VCSTSFYTRLFKIKDPVTGLPVFAQLQVTLACAACKEAGLAAQCKHMLHLVPQWQSSARHERLKAVMSDRPDLIQSELSGLAFDALNQCFRAQDIDAFIAAEAPLPIPWYARLARVTRMLCGWGILSVTHTRTGTSSSSWSSTPRPAAPRATSRSSRSTATGDKSRCAP